jgi:hypothetical protein
MSNGLDPQRLVVNAERLVRVLDELVDRERGVVRLDDGVTDLHRDRENQRPPCTQRERKQHTFGDGTTEKVAIMRSGNSSRILEMRRVPMPDPVPPPANEHVSRKPGCFAASGKQTNQGSG